MDKWAAYQAVVAVMDVKTRSMTCRCPQKCKLSVLGGFSSLPPGTGTFAYFKRLPHDDAQHNFNFFFSACAQTCG